MKSKFILFITAVFLMSFSLNSFAQNKPAPGEVGVYYSLNGNANNPQLSTTPAPVKEKSPQMQELERQLETARTSGNTMAARNIQAQIDNLLGSQQVQQPCMNSDFTMGNPGNEQEYDYNQTTIHQWSVYSHAFGVAPAGSPIAGRLFYMLIQDSFSGADTLKVMYSTNNGASWTTLMWGTANYTFNKDEMDIEVVYDGTNTWVFGVVGVTDNSDGRKKIYFMRQKGDGSGYYWTLLNFPGSGAGMNYYNPRITSDNANFTSNAYVMMLCSMDSTAGATHYAKQKYVYSSTPFDATPGLNYGQPSGNDGFYWSTSNVSTSGYLYGDIAYYKDDGGTGQNRVMSVYNYYNSGFNSIYIAYLSSYGTYGGNVVVTETNVNKDLRIAFNGGANNRNGMITYVRMYNATDWDIFGLRTTTGGSTAGAWVRDTIDYSGDRSRTCDLIGVRNASNQFKICYAQDNPTAPAAFYRTFGGSSWSAKITMATASPDTVWAETKAGYILGGGDDGIGIWSTMNGYNGYSSRNMMTTTGITGNNEIPNVFSLSQNYPNPFNPSTKIQFALPVSANVSLRVFDVTGRQVAEIVNGNLQAGLHEYSFNARDLSSGVYFYRLETDGFTDIKKMMLVK